MPAPVLITIALSHYCEKARFALDRAGVRYLEQAHIPLVSRLFTTPRGGGTVPVLVTPHGVLKDSTAILEFADRQLPAGQRLFPDDRALRDEVAALEDGFDRSLGVATRAWAYALLLERRAVIARVLTQRVPRAERLAARALMPAIVLGIRKALRIGPTTASWARARVDAELAAVAARLADGRAFLTGDRLTAADLSFATLVAPAVLPDHYGGVVPALDELPGAMAADVHRWRATPAGAFALRVYREHRRERVS